MTDTERKEVELKPCPFCGGKGLPQSHPGNPMTTGWFHSIECQSCFGGTFHYADTKEKAIEAWNKRPQDNNALTPLSVDKVEQAIVSHVGKGEEFNEVCNTMDLAKMICAKFGKDNSGMVPFPDVDIKTFFKWYKHTYDTHRKGGTGLNWGQYLYQELQSKFSQQPPKEPICDICKSKDHDTLKCSMATVYRTPKERKVSLEEVAKAIHHVKCHQLCPNERELIKRIGVSGVTYCKAQAILSLLNAVLDGKEHEKTK